MLMFMSIDTSCQKFCKPFSVGCVLKLIQVHTPVTVMRFNVRDKIAWHAAIKK